MTAGLETFAKVRALHDRTDNHGEKAAVAGRMEALGRAAGMTPAEAMFKLDGSKPAAPRNPFENLFNTLEFRMQTRCSRQHRACLTVGIRNTHSPTIDLPTRFPDRLDPAIAAKSDHLLECRENGRYPDNRLFA